MIGKYCDNLNSRIHIGSPTSLHLKYERAVLSAVAFVFVCPSCRGDVSTSLGSFLGRSSRGMINMVRNSDEVREEAQHRSQDCTVFPMMLLKQSSASRFVFNWLSFALTIYLHPQIGLLPYTVHGGTFE